MKQVPLIRIVDDDPSVGASFRFVLEAVGYQVRTYESAAEFLDGDDPTREGCMLLDVRMPGLSGPELQTRLAEMKCDLLIIFLTAHGEVRMAVEAVQAGPSTFSKSLSMPKRFCRFSHEGVNFIGGEGLSQGI